MAWLEDGDLGKALEVMPRRCVAERSIWEFWKRTGSRTDYLGALGGVSYSLGIGRIWDTPWSRYHAGGR